MRRTVAFLYAFHLLVAADGIALVPLIPTYTTQFDLSVFEAGLVVAAPAIAMFALSVPVGLLSDRVGPRVVTVAASSILAVSALGQGIAGSYAVLLLSWTLFGITSAIIYTAAPAWLAAAAPPERRGAAARGGAAFCGARPPVPPA